MNRRGARKKAYRLAAMELESAVTDGSFLPEGETEEETRLLTEELTKIYTSLWDRYYEMEETDFRREYKKRSKGHEFVSIEEESECQTG